jgi:hypothetical protein
MTLWAWFALYVDLNAIVGMAVYAIAGSDGLHAFCQSIINRFWRGVRG